MTQASGIQAACSSPDTSLTFMGAPVQKVMGLCFSEGR